MNVKCKMKHNKQNNILVHGAREHNLKNISALGIPGTFSPLHPVILFCSLNYVPAIFETQGEQR